MKLSLESDHHIYRIHAYAPEQVVIKNPLSALPDNFALLSDEEQWQALYTLTETSFILAPEQLQLSWTPTTLNALAAEDIEPILQYMPEVILLGTGQKLQFPAAEILAPIHRAGVGIEVMDSHAACRTYNILAAEGRVVVLAVILP